MQNNLQDEPQEGPIQSMQNTNGGTTTFAASKDNEGHGSWTPIGFKGQQNTPENENKQTFAGAFNYMRTDSKKFSSDARHIEEIQLQKSSNLFFSGKSNKI